MSVVIVNYNSGRLLSACIKSLQAVKQTCWELIVVDNNSTDGSAERAQLIWPGIRVIRNKKNLGYAGAVNMGFQATSGEYVLVINPDIQVTVSSISELAKVMNGSPDVGLCAPKLLNPDGSLQYSCRTHYTFTTVLMRRTVLGRLFPEHRIIRRHLMLDWDHLTTRDVDWVLGAAMMLRREAFHNMPVMDERFFLYFEDVDLCIRLRKQGWRIVYHPQSIMVHHHQRASAVSGLTRAKYEHVKSWLKFLWKYRRESLIHQSEPPPRGTTSC